jgi:hypothetical protein
LFSISIVSEYFRKKSPRDNISDFKKFLIDQPKTPESNLPSAIPILSSLFVGEAKAKKAKKLEAYYKSR